jgi:hypothetical protein
MSKPGRSLDLRLLMDLEIACQAAPSGRKMNIICNLTLKIGLNPKTRGDDELSIRLSRKHSLSHTSEHFDRVAVERMHDSSDQGLLASVETPPQRGTLSERKACPIEMHA